LGNLISPIKHVNGKENLLDKVSHPLVLQKLLGRKTLFKVKIKQSCENVKTKMTQQYGIYKTLLIKTLILSLETFIFYGTPELLRGKHLGKRTWNPQMDGRKFWLKTLSTIFTHINFLYISYNRELLARCGDMESNPGPNSPALTE